MECIEAVVRVEGSLAKDTWLSEDPDIDVFMRVSPSIPRSQLGELALRIARRATAGARQVERFAEHPYLEAFLDDTRINIVPCYDAVPGEWLSATDRTPYHTDYINKCLAPQQRDEVRLLKKFMKGVGVYGAEIKVGGFSGYCCELLILHCGSFAKTLETFAKHQPRRVIDIEGYYSQRPRELELLFQEPLVIIDPVDQARNVASAVQPNKLQTFAAASQAFLKTPSEEFFYPLQTTPLSAEELQTILRNRGAALIFLVFNRIDAVPDVLWGQLHRTLKALRRQLELADFKALRAAAYSEDDASFSVFVFEIEQNVLPSAHKHLGPPLERQTECEKYLAKYANNDSVIAGPFIEDDRWTVELPRKFTDAAELLRNQLSAGGKAVGVAGLVAKALRENFQVLIGDEIIEYYAFNEGFAEFLTAFLSGKPSWL
jgi:tRNA nucleotidyltransferase (CCA-adding enzyme)